MTQRAAKKLQEIISAHRPRHVLLAGFSGGLKENQCLGDICLPDAFYCAGENVRQSAACGRDIYGALKSHLQSKNIPLLKERLQISVPGLASVSEKRRWGNTYPDGCGLDMESYALAKICSESGIAFTCVRVILDEVGQEVPCWSNLAWTFWTLPAWVGRVRYAAKNLAVAVQGVIGK